ncbi:hypothetical protein HBH56_154430 [Parastagonospora nodorum]|nr:hypothetical protein HBH56_154430 [Parastagonospora nodorum]KAH3926568.1 hypothetical protein HBH54_163260 [Parastagonospora nodorum]KAH3970340.1 hypothetical protein HBH52_167610 [Parastagonospora nodorum]KAH3971958.1 hypothetical protein HBH51_105610 [Parastagonospora nodorum]KAH4047685.1 hypothetical protein HBH49_168380 [Parastagonospora nodorum]
MICEQVQGASRKRLCLVNRLWSISAGQVIWHICEIKIFEKNSTWKRCSASDPAAFSTAPYKNPASEYSLFHPARANGFIHNVPAINGFFGISHARHGAYASSSHCRADSQSEATKSWLRLWKFVGSEELACLCECKSGRN